MVRREASGKGADSLSPRGAVSGREGKGESWRRELGIWVKGGLFYQLSKPRENQEAPVKGVQREMRSQV